MCWSFDETVVTRDLQKPKPVFPSRNNFIIYNQCELVQIISFLGLSFLLHKRGHNVAQLVILLRGLSKLIHEKYLF